MKNKKGMTLIELIIVMTIFSVVMAGLYSAYSVFLREGVHQFRLAESEMELGISKVLIERDIASAGYGLMSDYSVASGVSNTLTRAASASNSGTGSTDTLTLMGTALGLQTRAAQGWTYVSAVTGTIFRTWNDAREDIVTDASGTFDDIVIISDPNELILKAQGSSWLFRYNGQTSNITTLSGTPLSTLTEGMVLYGLYTYGSDPATLPYYVVKYYLSGTPPSSCQQGTLNLLRAESREVLDPSYGDPVMECVLDFQVAFGLDTNENGDIDLWDNGGTTAATYNPKDLNKRLIQIKAYALVQSGKYDPTYIYSNPDPGYASKTDFIRVGELNLVGGATGRDFQLSSDQRKYRWKVINYTITPRNIRPN